MKIKRIKIKNFRSFSNKETVIDIENFFSIFTGENGAGKTSIILALRYALFGTQGIEIKADELVNKINKDNMRVVLECEKNGKEITIERGRVRKQSYVKLFIDKKELDLPSVKEYDKKIEELIGFNYKMFDYISINSSIFTKNFFKMKKKEKETFIKEILKIEEFYQLIEKFKELKKKKEYQKETLENEKRIIENLIEDRKRELKELSNREELKIKENKKEILEILKTKEEKEKELIKNIEKEENLNKKEILLKEIKHTIKDLVREKENIIEKLDNANTDIFLIEKKIKDYENALKKIDEIERIKKNIKTAKSRFYQKWLFLKQKEQELIKKADKINQAIIALNRKGTYLNRITKGKLKEFIEKYGEGIIKFLFIADSKYFFLRGKPFKNMKIDFQSQELIKEFEDFKNKLLRNETNANNYVENEKEKLLKKYKEYIKINLSKLKETNDLKNREYYLTELQKLYNRKNLIENRDKIEEKIVSYKKKEADLIKQISELQKYKGYSKQYREIQKEIRELNEKINKVEIKEEILKRIEKEQNEIKEKENTLKEIKEKIIILNEEIKKANEIVKKDAEEAIKETIRDFLKIFNYYINKYSDELKSRFLIRLKDNFSIFIKERGKGINYNTLSKGEETLINLILILALNESLKAMSNINFNLLIFDEIDGTLDKENFQVLVNKLSELKKDIIFVTHRKEIKEIEKKKNMKIYEIEKEIFSKIKEID